MDKKFLCNLHITHNHQQVVMVLIFLTDRLRIKFVEYLSFEIEQSIKYERWTKGRMGEGHVHSKKVTTIAYKMKISNFHAI